ncbi:MAG: 4'-phosphopantetheinyl transferase superfamily protein, partial [Bacteroidetes bacterium]|nr:4'-phosphopantetheinyl transferase superfamily protein [Bacteroidota bacterium]
MIKGIGVDFIEVGRIQKTINNYGEQFLNRIFTNGEQLYCSRKPHSAQHYAAR